LIVSCHEFFFHIKSQLDAWFRQAAFNVANGFVL